MKLLAILFVLVNILIFVWTHSTPPIPDNTPSAFHPELVQIVTPTAPPASQAIAGAPAAIIVPTKLTSTVPSLTISNTTLPVSAPSMAAASPTTKQVPTPASPDDKLLTVSLSHTSQSDSTVTPTLPPSPTSNTPVCFTWGPVDAQASTQAATELNQLHLGNRLRTIINAAEPGPFWIYYPPLVDKATADMKTTEFKNKGIQDISVIRSGPWVNALSLGLYAKYDGALHRVSELKKLGINVQIEARNNLSRHFALLDLNPNEQHAALKIASHFSTPAMQTSVCSTP